MMIQQDSLDLNPPGGGKQTPQKIDTPAELLAMFDKGVKEARAVLDSAQDDHLKKEWSLLVGGKPVMTMPRTAVLRQTMSHMVHHRAQLGVYLRLNDVPVPSMYGPTADDHSF